MYDIYFTLFPIRSSTYAIKEQNTLIEHNIKSPYLKNVFSFYQVL